MKEGSLGWIDIYLGENDDRIKTTDSWVIWTINFQDYMNNDIEKVNKWVGSYGNPLHKRGKVKISILKY